MATVGKEAFDRLMKPDHKQGVIDTQREIDKPYFDEIEKCINSHSHWNDPFYIVVLTKKERTMMNVMRRYFIGRQSLPTTQWDQTVWRYTPKSEKLEFVWALPDENTAKWMASDPLNIPDEQRDLLAFVLEMLDKKLYKRMYEKYHREDVSVHEPS